MCKAGKLVVKSVLSKLRCQTWICFFPSRYPLLFYSLGCVCYQLFTMRSTFCMLATRTLARNIYLIHNIANQNLTILKCHPTFFIAITSMINVITQSDDPSTSTDILFHNARNNYIERRNETNSVHNENNELALENTILWNWP